MKVPIPPYPPQHLLLSIFLIIAIIVGVKSLLIFLALVTNDVEHLYVCSFSICIPSLENAYLSLLPFLIGLSFYYWVVRAFINSQY